MCRRRRRRPQLVDDDVMIMPGKGAKDRRPHAASPDGADRTGGKIAAFVADPVPTAHLPGRG
jgi:hypothetical protein